MPSELSLAEGLGVSRPVVREALKRLAHAGLVRIRHGGATLVSDYRRTAGPGLLSVLLLDRNGDLDLEVARSIVEARSDLGPPVAAAAVRRAGADDVAALHTDRRTARPDHKARRRGPPMSTTATTDRPGTGRRRRSITLGEAFREFTRWPSPRSSRPCWPAR